MTDNEFRSLCNVYGFAPSRSLRELLDTVTAQARLVERQRNALIADEHASIEGIAQVIAAQIRSQA